MFPCTSLCKSRSLLVKFNRSFFLFQRHLSTVTSICMVQPPHTKDFDKGKEEFRRSMRRRENVDFIKIRKQRLLEQQSEDEEENENIQNNNPDSVDGTCCSNLNRFSKMLDSPSSILDYKDLIKSISLQLFSKSKTTNNRKLSNNDSIPLETKSDNETESDERTMNFVLTQKFIGWKV